MFAFFWKLFDTVEGWFCQAGYGLFCAVNWLDHKSKWFNKHYWDRATQVKAK
jgi:hypothetical protein